MTLYAALLYYPPGRYWLEAASMDEAITWAARIPASWRGKIELRPVVPMSNKPG